MPAAQKLFRLAKSQQQYLAWQCLCEACGYVWRSKGRYNKAEILPDESHPQFADVLARQVRTLHLPPVCPNCRRPQDIWLASAETVRLFDDEYDGQYERIFGFLRDF